MEQNSGDLEVSARHQAQLTQKYQDLIKKAAPVGAAYYGGLGRIRTPDPLIRSQVLYPTELPIHCEGDLAVLTLGCKTQM